MEKCEGQDATNNRLLITTRVIYLSPSGGGIFYSNEYQLSLEKYRTNLQAYSTLTRYQNVVPAQVRVQKILDGIQVSNIITTGMSKDHVLDNLLGYWLRYVS